MYLSRKKFSLPEIDETDIKSTKEYLEKIFYDLKGKFREFSVFQELILSYRSYSADFLVNEQKPEELAKETIIEPLLRYLGFAWTSETKIKSPFGNRWPDYTIFPSQSDDIILYVEAEAINSNLYSETKGRGQVFQWLLSKAAKTEYGIATDGFSWILVKFDEATNQIKDVQNVDLRPYFSSLLNPKFLITEAEIKELISKLFLLRPDNLKKLINEYLTNTEEDKEEITKEFYDEYVKYVFGLNRKGESIGGICLLNSIIPPKGIKKAQSELFAVVTMNRLFFITFLDDKGIIHKNLLSGLYERYKESHLGKSFYYSYLRPLFYEVFNKGKQDRESYIKSDDLYRDIPYLNSGLFRENIENEDDYDIRNEGLESIISSLLNYDLLKDYKIGLSEEAELKPEILGYIFEKTINYISGTGTNQQKMQGAYYTPEDVVNFIVKETLNKKIFDKMKQGLETAGWQEKDFRGYETIEDVLGNMPPNRKHCYAMLNAIDTIRVIDPACGSGHFLTTAANVMTRIIASIQLAIGEPIDLYQIKRKVISYNIFGVDIDEIGAEITKLRLWLSIISEVRDIQHTETLPNIDFNIMSGNTLIGQLNEKLVLSLPATDGSFIDGDDLNYLGNFLGDDKSEIFSLLSSVRTDDLSAAYQKILARYRSESGENAVRMHDVLGKIKKQLYGALNEAYYSYLVSNEASGKISSETWKAITSGKSFHWGFDFFSAFENGGFDVIIGNPPYIEDKDYSKPDLSIIKSVRMVPQSGKVPLLYESQSCGNTHAYFIERSLNMLNNTGNIGFIVPISLISTERMGSIRKFIHEKAYGVGYFNFDDRPGKIFSGIEHCRSTIVIATKGKGSRKVLTSKYHRWYSSDRPNLFLNLKTADFKIQNNSEIIPKLGSEIECAIMNKLFKNSDGKIIGDFLVRNGVKIWYHNAPQYWIHAHTDGDVPMVEYYEAYSKDPKTNEIIFGKLKEKSITTQYKSIEVGGENADLIVALLNSSLFYWWYVIYSDGRHLLPHQINSFPLNVAIQDDVGRVRLKSITSKLMKEYGENSNEKRNVRKGDYAIKIKEIIPRKSYDTISEIDEVLFQMIGLTREEADFVRKFDIEFRIGENNIKEDPENVSRRV